MSSNIRVAVLGAGSLGKEHVRVYSELATAGLVELTNEAWHVGPMLASKPRLR